MIDLPTAILFVADFPILDVAKRRRVTDPQEIKPIIHGQRRRAPRKLAQYPTVPQLTDCHWPDLSFHSRPFPMLVVSVDEPCR